MTELESEKKKNFETLKSTFNHKKKIMSSSHLVAETVQLSFFRFPWNFRQPPIPPLHHALAAELIPPPATSRSPHGQQNGRTKNKKNNERNARNIFTKKREIIEISCWRKTLPLLTFSIMNRNASWRLVIRKKNKNKAARSRGSRRKPILQAADHSGNQSKDCLVFILMTGRCLYFRPQ